METFSALLALCAGNSPVHGEAGGLRRYCAHYDVTVMKGRHMTPDVALGIQKQVTGASLHTHSIRWGIFPKPGLTYFFYDMNYLFITGSHFINLLLNQHLLTHPCPI